jgi:undecaprenyl diphosphate synthase
LDISKATVTKPYFKKFFSTKQYSKEYELPNHIAFIWDGNRRWAQSKYLNPSVGHEIGIGKIAPQILKDTFDLGVHTSTMWLFAPANWKRDQDAIDKLMEIEESFVINITPFCQTQQVKLIHLGRKDRISSSFLKAINYAEKITLNFNRHVFNLAVDYDGRDEIIRALKKLHIKDQLSNLREEEFTDFLDTKNQPYPDPDLIIRTSGEQRLSGFMSWQSKNSEFIFLDKYAPDLTCEDIVNAIQEFSQRKRRFGS